MEPDRLRQYWYYSDKKIKHFSSQIRPPGWKRALNRIEAVEAKLAANVGPVGTGPSGRIEIRPPELEEEMLQLLQNVVRKLEKQKRKLVGTFDEPKSFFYGQLEFYFGYPYGNVDPPAFWLAGATDQTIIGLGGSVKHMEVFRGHEVRATENAQKVSMEPEVAALIHAAEVGSEDAAMERSATAGSWASYVVLMFEKFAFENTKKLDFEVLAARQAVDVVTAPSWDSPRQVVSGSPIFVAYP